MTASASAPAQGDSKSSELKVDSQEALLSISKLHAGIEGKEILKGLSLSIRPGEVHAIMGPNGSGKSTLSKVIAGHPLFPVISGSVTFAGEDLLALEPDEREILGADLADGYTFGLRPLGCTAAIQRVVIVAGVEDIEGQGALLDLVAGVENAHNILVPDGE